MASLWLERGPLTRLLWPLSRLFAALLRIRALCYRRGWLRSTRMPVPVVVVGNLVVGGTGKTPAVLATVALLRRAGWSPGIVSRGHGRRDASLRHVEPDSGALEVGDEPLLLRLRSSAPVTVASDRPAAARALLSRHPGVDVIVSDDGLQHLALECDVSVLLFDERGVGNGWLLPAGPLREPLPAALQPRSLVLYNAPAPSTPLPGCLSQRRLAGAVALEAWWAGAPARLESLHDLAGRPLLAVAGLARPERFFAMLREAGLAFDALALPDHYDFANLPWPADAPDVVITEKDAVKLRPERMARVAPGSDTRIWVVALDFEPDSVYAETLLGWLDRPASAAP